ncbi:MAG: hypothetical protein MZV64_19820 [Ignavibacteriales bacterium]|nr:hypothetical protein [Ignavibacteriales bacterium]
MRLPTEPFMKLRIAILILLAATPLRLQPDPRGGRHAAARLHPADADAHARSALSRRRRRTSPTAKPSTSKNAPPATARPGLGDGAQGIQLGVTVPAFALPEIARPSLARRAGTPSSRAARSSASCRPFASLNDQERWDVVAYIITLHTSDEQIQKGKEIFESTCADCPTDFYRDPTKMSGLSMVGLARIVTPRQRERSPPLGKISRTRKCGRLRITCAP